MKKITLILLCFFPLTLFGQNLVPNPGFEYHNPSYVCNCCGSGNIATCLRNWDKANHTTPDFFGTCCQISYPGGIPSNQSYEIKFFVSLSENSNRALSNIGIYFSDTLIHYPPQPIIHMLNFSPQFQNPDSNIITDKTEWVEISGMYNATGGEKYIVIGNFYDDSSSNLIPVPGTLVGIHAAYYYIDDVSIKAIDTIHYPASAGNDTSICLGDSIRIGLYDFSDYNYQWTATTYINCDSIGNPWVKPDTTTTYYLYQVDNYGVQKYDTVTVHVDCYPANAGPDTVICKGDSIQIGTHNYSHHAYKWRSEVGGNIIYGVIADSTSGTTIVYPDTSTLFVLKSVDSTGNPSWDSVFITVVDCDTLSVSEYGLENIRLYPNPANGIVYVEYLASSYKSERSGDPAYAGLQAASRLEILDLYGKVLVSKEINGVDKRLKIDVSGLPDGIYFLRIISEKERVQRKVVVLKK